MSCSIRLNVVTASHHNKANNPDQQHKEQALRPTPSIENLGQWEFGKSTKEAGHDTSRCRQGMLLKGTGDKWIQSTGDNLLDRCDEVDEPDTVMVMPTLAYYHSWLIL